MGYGVHVRDALAEHKHTVILLHGRGSTGEEFAEELEGTTTSSKLSLFEHFPNVRWVFPCAELRWSTVFEEEMSEWFDTPSLTDITLRKELQVDGLGASVQFVLGVIQDEVKLAGSATKVVLGGISQGQATSLHALLCGRRRLGGFVGTSGWFPFADEVEGLNTGSVTAVSNFLRHKLGVEAGEVEEQVCVADTPMFLGHGTDDEIVDVKLGRQARDLLTGIKELQWKEYVGAEVDGHWFKEPEQMDDIVDFLKSCFKE